MKRLITLFFSAAFLCPMLAGAQTVPNSSSTQTTVGALGLMNFSFPNGNNLQLPSTIVVPSGLNTNYNSANSVFSLYLNAYMPNNSQGSVALSGYADVGPQNISNGLFAGYGVPVTGAMMYGGGGSYPYYSLQINIGTTAFVCSISASTLNGTCQGTASQGPVAITYNGIATN